MPQSKTPGGRLFRPRKTRRSNLDQLARSAEALIKIASNGLWSVSDSAFQQIKDPESREAAETIFYSCLGFAAAGLAIGTIAGPKGMAIGGVTGAVCGLVCGGLVISQSKMVSPRPLRLVPSPT